MARKRTLKKILLSTTDIRGPAKRLMVSVRLQGDENNPRVYGLNHTITESTTDRIDKLFNYGKGSDRYSVNVYSSPDGVIVVYRELRRNYYGED